jgi:hypothetical protein
LQLPTQPVAILDERAGDQLDDGRSHSLGEVFGDSSRHRTSDDKFVWG